MRDIQRVNIKVTAENVWFFERYLNVFDFSDLFPADAFSTDEIPGTPVILHTDLGFDIETDIDRAKMQLRNRSRHRGWVRWTDGHSLRIGDVIQLERQSEREYALRLVRDQSL